MRGHRGSTVHGSVVIRQPVQGTASSANARPTNAMVEGALRHGSRPGHSTQKQWERVGVLSQHGPSALLVTQLCYDSAQTSSRLRLAEDLTGMRACFSAVTRTHRSCERRHCGQVCRAPRGNQTGVRCRVRRGTHTVDRVGDQRHPDRVRRHRKPGRWTPKLGGARSPFQTNGSTNALMG